MKHAPGFPASSPVSQRSPLASIHPFNLPVIPLQFGDPRIIASQASRSAGSASSSGRSQGLAPATVATPSSTACANSAVGPRPS